MKDIVCSLHSHVRIVLALSCLYASAASSWAGDKLPPAFKGALTQPTTVTGKPEFRARPITVECRVILTSADAFNIIVASDPKSSADHWELYTYQGSGNFSVFQPGWGGDYQSDTNICDGKWHHIAAYLGENVVKLYVDGKMVLERDTPGAASGASDPGDLAFGSLVEGGFGCTGEIDDVRISKGERHIAWNSEPAKSDGQTIGLWDFDAIAAASATPEPTPDNRASLPEYKIIPAALANELTPANGWPAPKSFEEWNRSLGGPTSNRYSSLSQINRSNVKRLDEAWTYHSGDGQANIQANPVIVDGTIFLPTAGGNIAAVNGETGVEIWRHVFKNDGPLSMEGVPARRGLLYWPGDGRISARLIVGIGNKVWALDPKTGKTIESFGSGGATDLPTGAAVAGAVYKNVLVMPGYGQDVFGYDIGTGKLLWRFKTVPSPGQEGGDTWRGPEKAGANCWGGMALDESRGIAYISTGSPKGNFIGMPHLGDNRLSDSVIALNAVTGERLWDFQEIRHDIWDMDIPAPPNLATITLGGKKIDVVAQVTKYGNTLLLDRVSGKPIFPFRLRKAPAGKLPGEETAVYQPYLELPEPFAKQEFTREDITNRTPEAKAFVERELANANMGWFETYEENIPTAFFGIHGGAEWTGAAVDPAGRLYVSSNHMPWTITIVRDGGSPPPSEFAAPDGPGAKVYKQYCAACHGLDRGGNGMIPPLKGIKNRLTESEVMTISKNGKDAMPPPAPMSDEQRQELMGYLFEREGGAAPTPAATGPAHYTFTGYNKLLDQDNYPGSKPPWGTLDCIDLNTGKRLWSKPLGEYPELTKAGIPKTGQENFGGPMVTGSGLVFCSGTRDKKIRAFDSATGEELWSADLPEHGTAPPATYQIKGRQFIVLPATGGGKLGGPTGDAWVAFALKH